MCKHLVVNPNTYKNLYIYIYTIYSPIFQKSIYLKLFIYNFYVCDDIYTMRYNPHIGNKSFI